MAALVLGLLVVGFAMVWLVSDLGAKFQLYQLHKSFGVTVFALVLMRLGWRHLNPVMPAPPTNLRPWERAAALLTHRGFYVLLLLMPLTGWLTASASPLGIPTIVFGLFRCRIRSVRTQWWRARCRSSTARLQWSCCCFWPSMSAPR